MMEPFKANVRVTDHQLWLITRFLEDEAIWPPTGAPGFVHFGGPGGMVATGIAGGLVDLEVQFLDQLPDVDDTWEDIDEGDLEAPHEGLRVAAGMYLETVCPLGPPDTPERVDALYRVRVSATGRAVHYDGTFFDEPPVERYLIQVCPSTEKRGTIVHRHESGR